MDALAVVLCTQYDVVFSAMLSVTEIRKNAVAFAERWKDATNENAEERRSAVKKPDQS